jgi:hypothetical protein
MPQFHLRVRPLDEGKIPEVMQAINHYKADHPGMSQFEALSELIFLGQTASKEKEEREEKKIRLTRSDGRRGG